MLYLILALFGVSGVCGAVFGFTLLGGLVTGVPAISVLRWLLGIGTVTGAGALGVTAYVAHKQQKTYQQVLEEVAEKGIVFKK